MACPRARLALSAALLTMLVSSSPRANASGAPFCGVTSVPGMDDAVRLKCDSAEDVLSEVVFAAYGRPAVDGPCDTWSASPSCDVGANASLFVRAACLGHNACAVPTFDVLFGGLDPCPGKDKWLAVTVTCAAGSGTAGGGASCAVNGTSCPLPLGWGTWNLTLSTVVEPGGDIAPGYYAFPKAGPFGLVCLDWSVAASIWQHNNQSESTIEATLTENCRRIKAVSPSTRCFIYRNLELALQAMESDRAIMYDPEKAGWFVPSAGAGSSPYNEPGGPGDQFFWDMRVPGAADWFITSSLALVSSPFVDGLFTDDLEGFPSEHDYAVANTNTSFTDVAALQFASLAVHGRLVAALAARGKYNWQAMGSGYQGEYVGDGVPHDPAGCAAFMRARCSPQQQLRPTMQAFDSSSVNQSIASFLITRGPVAYLGSGWESGGESSWNDAFLFDVGEPQGLCKEQPEGVFSRPWTYGTALLDCTSFLAIVPAKA